MEATQKIGLVLSGGGAKGAYQLGVFRAMRELGIDQRIGVLSGTSIGALNAILFATGHPRIADGVWRRMAGMLSSAGGGKARGGKLHSTEPLSTALWMLTRITGVYGKRRIFACAYDIDAASPAYFELNAHSPREAAVLCAASCALPHLFLPVEFGGRRYCDGGGSSIDSDRMHGDKYPTAPLRGLGLGKIIICYLVPGDRADLSGFSAGTEFIELHPSRPLEEHPHGGTLDFTPEILAQRAALGYSDALALFRSKLGND